MRLLDAVDEVLDELRRTLHERGEQYGETILNPSRVFTKDLLLTPTNILDVLLDVKISRLVNGKAGQKDTILDLAGYLVLRQAIEIIRQKNTEKISKRG